MPAQLIDGKTVSDALMAALSSEVKEKNLKPKLVTVLVGENPASLTYISNKAKACAKVGIEFELKKLGEEVSQKELLELVRALNDDAAVHGLLVQLPLPKHIDEAEVSRAVAPEKDVDGYTPLNLGRLMAGDEFMPSCTPAGVIHLLEVSGVKLEGANAVVVGRSITVGRPLAAMLLNRNATVTVCHSKTKNLAEVTRNADVLCVAVGKPKMITASMVKKGAVVIDVGINRVDGNLVGDVDFEGVKEVAGKITPVPGGVGPMTVAMLLKNTVRACERHARS